MKTLFGSIAVLLTLLAGLPACGGTLLVTPADTAQTPLQIPRLCAALILDGNLGEWKPAACVPVRPASAPCCWTVRQPSA